MSIQNDLKKVYNATCERLFQLEHRGLRKRLNNREQHERDKLYEQVLFLQGQGRERARQLTAIDQFRQMFGKNPKPTLVVNRAPTPKEDESGKRYMAMTY